jgi:hypothetical protein
MLSFNEFIGKETISREYKEFSLFKKSLQIDITQSEKYCDSNLFEFNDYVLSNLKSYIKEYIPRYSCGFWNAKIKESELFIGVNDYGLVKGIPYQGEIDQEYIKSYILKIFNKYIKYDKSIHIKDETKIDFEIEFINVENPDKPSENNHQEYKKYLYKKSIFEKKYHDFIKKVEEWKDKYYVLNYKLVDIVNTPETRNQLKEFIKKKDETNPILSLLETDFKLETISGFEMKDIKLDKNNPYYWVTTFKDETVEQYKKSKPIFKEEFNRPNLPYNLLISVSDMIPYWMNYNKNMNLYILKIKMKCQDQISFSYFDCQSKNWLKCKRFIFKNQPVCLPI